MTRQSVGPSWVVVAYHVPFLIQLGLLHQKFESRQFEGHRGSLRMVRMALTPINIFLALEIMHKYCFQPLTRAGSLNLQLACWLAHLIMRSIEWGFALPSPSDPTFQLRPGFHSHLQPPQQSISEKSLDSPPSFTDSADNEPNNGYLDVLVWSFHQMTSTRGIDYVWGWKGRKEEPPTLLQTMRRFLICHVVQLAAVITLVLCRDHGSPTKAMESLGLPSFPGLVTVAEGLATFAWGMLCMYGLEFAFCFLAFTAHLVNFFSENVYRLPDSFMQWWDLRLFVPLFGSPLTAKSLASLWAFHWHQVYRRSFHVLGASPASRFAAKLGLSINHQRICGLLGAFIVSSVFHEIGNHQLGRPAEPPLALRLLPFVSRVVILLHDAADWYPDRAVCDPTHPKMARRRLLVGPFLFPPYLTAFPQPIRLPVPRHRRHLSPLQGLAYLRNLLALQYHAVFNFPFSINQISVVSSPGFSPSPLLFMLIHSIGLAFRCLYSVPLSLPFSTRPAHLIVYFFCLSYD
ncbi:uncharacterized protein VP01_91g6 [Puccinia sorghi]|uniref:Wax synthase domain-containing protein n=1 Tax=Puccinia sorghi TaxID=27349 RepID=A0A0L6U7B8_9BASI|nr:uncharacterized protein VP01_91g6 [Puccinia sorghi]